MPTNEFIESNNTQSATLQGTDWDQERMNTLAGFEDKTLASQLVEETAVDSEPLLEEDPHLLHTKQAFQNHPFSKLGLVAISTLILTGTTGAFLSANFIGTSKPQQREQQSELIAKKDAQSNSETTDNQGRVLTDLALTTQGKELEALNARKNPSMNIKKTSKPATRDKTQPTTYSPPSRPVIARATQRTYLSPPRQTTKYPPPHPSYSTKPVVQPKPIATVITKDLSTPVQEVDPMKAWVAAAQIGSYGQSFAPETASGTNTVADTKIIGNQPAVEYAALSIPQRQQQKVLQNPQQKAQQTPEVNFDEETAILQEQPRQLIMPGTKAKGVLTTPFAWDETEERTQGDLLSVVLSEPLLAADSSVVLPTKTQLLVEVQSVSKGGLVRLVVVNAIILQGEQQHEVVLPENAVEIYGSKGKPLVAQKLNKKRQENRRADVNRFAIGAIRKAAGLVNRPRSESVVSNNSGFSRSTQNDSPNLLAGVLEGGAEAILDDLDKRNEDVITAIEQHPDIFFLKAGIEVEVLVKSSAVIDVPAFEQRILDSQNLENDHLALVNAE